VGLLIFTAGFFGAHSVASGWMVARATRHRGQASALYLMAYYAGSSVMGALLGLVFLHGGWSAIAATITALFAAALWCVAGVDRRGPSDVILPGSHGSQDV
jgi:predicted MFS family arabinose efflux permease